MGSVPEARDSATNVYATRVTTMWRDMNAGTRLASSPDLKRGGSGATSMRVGRPKKTCTARRASCSAMRAPSRRARPRRPKPGDQDARQGHSPGRLVGHAACRLHDARGRPAVRRSERGTTTTMSNVSGVAGRSRRFPGAVKQIYFELQALSGTNARRDV